MSQSVVLNTSSQATINTDTAKLFVFNNRYADVAYDGENDTYDDVVIPAGTLMGKISATQKVIPLASGASDGSQYPVGVLAEDITILAGDTVSKTVSICVAGDVEESLIVLDGSDTLATVISGRSIRDRIGADTDGIKLVAAIEMTSYDNN